jgi:hypothetical protein
MVIIVKANSTELPLRGINHTKVFKNRPRVGLAVLSVDFENLDLVTYNNSLLCFTFQEVSGEGSE